MRPASGFQYAGFFSVTLLSLSCGIRGHAQEHYRHSSVCEVRAHPRASNLQSVEIDAEFIDAMPHGLYLRDPLCPKQVLQIDYELEGADKSIADLQKNLWNGWINSTRTPSGRFFGTVKRDSSSKRMYLFLHSVSDLRINGQPIEDPDTPKPISIEDSIRGLSVGSSPPIKK